MIRYEVYSNAASSEVGLRDYPVLKDLEDSFALNGIETKYFKQVAREEEQINVASSKLAKGVKVHETATKTLHPETTLKGCVNWARRVVGHPGRGLHLHIEKARATNGAGLVMGLLDERGQRTFLTGLEEGTWEKMVVQPDITLTNIPEEIEKSKELKAEFLTRASRTTSFMGILQTIQELSFLPVPFLEMIREALKKRDGSGLKGLTEAQIINIGLISDTLERYQKLLADFHVLTETGQLGGDLPIFFNLLTHGIEFSELRAALLPFTLEIHRERVGNKRSLINDVRIGLARADSATNDAYRKTLLSLVLKARINQDPSLYRKAVRLHTADAEETEVLTENRSHFLEVRSQIAKLLVGNPEPETPASIPLRMLAFDLLITTAYQGEFQGHHREGYLPRKAAIARHILACCKTDKFDLRQLTKLNPKLPVKGVAQNLAGRTHFTNGDIKQIVSNLYTALYPYATVADTISAEIRKHFKDEEGQKTRENLSAYLEGAHPLLRYTNYVLGRAGQTPQARSTLLAAGRELGLTVLGSRDQIKNSDVLEKMQADPKMKVEGYVPLLFDEGAKLFPLGVTTGTLSISYRFLFTERVVHLVRRFVGKKITYLVHLHGNGLFEVLYQHLAWEHSLLLSRYQLGMILYRNKVVDRIRLKEFGFEAGAMKNGHERDNPWLHDPTENTEKEGAATQFDEKVIGKNFTEALAAVNEFVKKKIGGDTSGLAAVVARLWSAGEADPGSPIFKEEISKTPAADTLWKRIQEVTAQQFKAIVPEETEQEAIELLLPGPLAYLTLLKASHPFKVEGKDLLFHIRPAPDMPEEQLDQGSRLVTAKLKEQTGSGDPLVQAVGFLSGYQKVWDEALLISMIVLTGQMLRETITTLVVPAPPNPKQVTEIPQERVLCLGMSSADQGRFHKIIKRPDIPGSYATLSQLANWLITFNRLRDEFQDFREIIGEIQGIIGSLNFSVFDAPYLKRYAERMEELNQAFNVRPEELLPEHLSQIEKTAMEIGRMTREIFDQERGVPLRDRWLGKVTMRLRAIRPNTELTFVQKLFERRGETKEGEQPTAEEPTGEKKNEYQTFSERVRNVIEIRAKLSQKAVFVISPGPSQGNLTIGLLERLFQLKGLFVPILADISNAQEFVEQLRTRLPPHRLFSLHDL